MWGIRKITQYDVPVCKRIEVHVGQILQVIFTDKATETHNFESWKMISFLQIRYHKILF